MNEHVILVAFTIAAADRVNAHAYLEAELSRIPLGHNPHVDAHVESWWVAEDDRQDGSDNDSAVFVPMGMQHLANRVVQYGDLLEEQKNFAFCYKCYSTATHRVDSDGEFAHVCLRHIGDALANYESNPVTITRMEQS